MGSQNKIQQEIAKEESGLLREIGFLEEFKQDVKDILRLKQEIDAISKFAQQKSVKSLNAKIKTLQEIVSKDYTKFEKLNRLLGKSERRRVRYEERVLGNIKELEEALDQSTKKSLSEILDQIQVYSARVISEISWRVGKIEKLIEEKKVDLATVQKHIEETLEAAKALIALMEHLQRLMKNIEKMIHRQKFIQPIQVDLAQISGFLRECAIKTAALKSIVPLRYFLEKGLGEKSWIKNWLDELIPSKIGKKYLETIEQYLPELLKALSEEEIEQVKNIRFAVPEGSILIFISGLKRPVLGFNLNCLPHFQFSGWVFHAIPGENLAQVVKTGNLSSPLEIILEKKNYFSPRFWLDQSTKRLTDGISFAFQNYEKYQNYVKDPYDLAKIGGFFILPLTDTLERDFILDFANTIDGYPEIVLRDKAYLNADASLIKDALVAVQKKYPVWLKKYSKTKDFFEMCCEKSSEDFIYQELPNFSLGRNKEVVQKIISFVESKNFFQFSLYVNQVTCHILSSDEYLIPPLARFSPEKLPHYLDGTIFQQGMDYLYEEKLSGKDLAGFSIVLALMKDKPSLFMHKSSYSSKDYLDTIKKMKPKDVEKLIKKTRVELIRAVSIIIPQHFRTSKPCTVPINKGVLFVDETMSDKDVLHEAVKKRVPIFAEFPYREFRPGIVIGGPIKKSSFDFILRRVLNIKDIKNGEDLASNNCYFYRKENGFFVHNRKTGRDYELA